MKTACILILVCLGVACAVDRPCPKLYSPVCGQDGQVYNNNCLMRNAEVEPGEWELCRGKHQLCPLVCTLEYVKTCGSDGKIYPSKCVMQANNCGKRMTVMELSFCGEE